MTWRAANVPAWLDDSRRPAGDAAASAFRIGNPRRPTEIASDYQEHALIETAFMQIVNQCGDRLVEKRRAVFHGLKDMVVDGAAYASWVVPIGDPSAQRSVQRRGDQIHARFHESSGQQAALSPRIAPIVKWTPFFGPGEV